MFKNTFNNFLKYNLKNKEKNLNTGNNELKIYFRLSNNNMFCTVTCLGKVLF
jgi:hypothetical protein